MKTTFFKKLRSKLAISHDMLLTIGAVTITLPPDHGLPGYLEAFQNYDRFLPALAREIPPGGWVIDVGGNCGDSLAAMIDANPTLNFLSLEADPYFFAYLEKNVIQIRKAYPTVGQILTIRALIGTVATSGVLIGELGTKRLIDADGGEHATPLAVVAHNFLPPNSTVSLIKVDVDGFDYDVMQSAGALLDSRETILYFECDFMNEIQKKRYVDLLNDLLRRGYSTFWLFDNFGAPVIATESVDVISALFDYVWIQRQERATKTIYYFDILACRPQSIAIVRRVLSEYPPLPAKA
jgi:FkbM family methyltransferase